MASLSTPQTSPTLQKKKKKEKGEKKKERPTLLIQA